MIYTCPVCQGSGFVPRKMYEVPGITCSFGSYMNDNGVIQCNSCNGTGVIRKNDWIKCTDRMPPDMKIVRVKINNIFGLPYEKEARWNSRNQCFEYFVLRTWEPVYGEVICWMQMPEPEED